MGWGQNVVVTSANCATAALLIPRLRERGYFVTGLVRRGLRSGAGGGGAVDMAGGGSGARGVGEANEIIADWMNAAAAKEALRRADVIVHLSGDANARSKAAFIDANYSTTKLVADHVGAGPQRIIYLSYPGAGAGEKNLYLRYKGEAEQLLFNTGKDVVIFRCPVIIDAPGRASRMDELFLAQRGKVVPVLGNGQQKLRPLYRGDVVNAIVAAIENGKGGIYELSGVEEMTIDEVVRLLNRDKGVRMRHIPAWLVMVLSHFMPGLSPTFADLILQHTHSSFDPGTYQEFGIEPTRISELYGAR